MKKKYVIEIEERKSCIGCFANEDGDFCRINCIDIMNKYDDETKPKACPLEELEIDFR
jgi:hypothetical protein